MPALRLLAVLGLLVSLAACDSASGPGGNETTGIWSGTARFQVDSVYADQNFHITTDYETRYEFDLEQEGTLVVGTLRQFNTGSFRLRESGIRDTTFSWNGELIRAWPVYGTVSGGILEVDLPEAEAAGVFPEDLWTFRLVGGRAQLDNTVIEHGYTFSVFENGGADFTVVLSPDKREPFSIRRQ
ncbi:MAG: hypothetical protein AAF845_08160 [Bacteroidota bacterium]